MNPTMEVPATKRLRTRAWDAVVDANPVLAKDLLVTARTPVFVGAIVVGPLLMAGLLIVLRLGMNSSFDADAGRQAFPVYFAGLALALGTLGAALGSTVIVQEREAGALDALKFSSLSPRRIVLGKFAAVILAEAAFIVCTLPILGFVLAMGGVSIGEAVVAVAIALASGIMTASLGVAVSARVANTRRSLLVSLAGAGAMGIAVTIWVAIASEHERWRGSFGVARAYFEAPFDGTYLAVLCVIPAYAVTTMVWLGYAAATSGLMDRSEDRSLPVKRWTVGALGLGALALSMCASTAEAMDRGGIAGTSMCVTAALALALIFTFVDEPVRATRRMQLNPRTLVVRAFLPQCLGPSVFFALVASGLALVSIPILSGASATMELQALWTVAALSVLGGLMGSIAVRRGATRARRAGAIALVGATFLVGLLRANPPDTGWVDAVCPLWLDLDYGVAGKSAMFGSLVAWTVAAFVSLAVMLHALRARASRAST